MWAEHLGGGVIKFHDTINIDDGVIDTLEQMADQALVEMYDLDPKGRYGINQSGHVIPMDQIAKMPIRINQPNTTTSRRNTKPRIATTGERSTPPKSGIRLRMGCKMGPVSRCNARPIV